MLFNSIEFIVFFPIVTLGYFLLIQKFRWMWLLAASIVFYMVAVPKYILIILFTIIVDYFAAIYIAKSEGDKRKEYLYLSIIVNVLTLGICKYFFFVFDNYIAVANYFGLNEYSYLPRWSIPLGLSFHTFQAMSYTIEVYRGNQKPERNFGIYALYVMFYPQMVAGPIERPQNILHQFYEKHTFNYADFTDGLRLMAWGLFKKVVVADRLSLFVGTVYDNPTAYTGLPLIIATLFFSIQIYCDFSGYSDIALGAARVMGFRLMINFDKPYFAETITDFWRKWHISLSSWFRDYLYIPLGGSKSSVARKYLNLFIVFMISGLWHGSGWCFVIWGALHAFYQIFGQKTAQFRAKIIEWLHIHKFPKFRKFINILSVFLIVTFAWIFFRANIINFAFHIVKNMFVGIPSDFGFIADSNFMFTNVYLGQSLPELIKGILGISLVFIAEYAMRKTDLNNYISSLDKWQRWSIYYLFLLIFVFFGVFDKPATFIYFQF